jgi:hypothetical protein
MKGSVLITYLIDGAAFAIQVDNAADAVLGDPVVLSNPNTDITATQPWYNQGFTVADLFSAAAFGTFRNAIASTLKSTLIELGKDTTGFALERYHHFVDDAAHAAVVSKTRALFQSHMSLNFAALQERLGEILGQPLTDQVSEIMPGQSGTMPIIIRINRPGSVDFNPVHKDIYEAFDHLGSVPRLVNFWIPVAGVGPQSALPLAPGSHLLDESLILRTRAGSVVEGRHYRVNSVLEWNGQRALERVKIREGQVLAFSSHLIHGLAINSQPDTTRVAVEFRLGPAAAPIRSELRP